MKKWVIQLDEDTYVAREKHMSYTTRLESAKRFRTRKKAKRHLRALLVYRKWTAPLVRSVVVSVALGSDSGAPSTARIFGEDLALSSIVSVTVENGPITRRITAAHAHHANALPGGPSQPWGAVRDAAEGSDEEPEGDGTCGCGECEEDASGDGILCVTCRDAGCCVGEPCRFDRFEGVMDRSGREACQAFAEAVAPAGQECGDCGWAGEVGEEMVDRCPTCDSDRIA